MLYAIRCLDKPNHHQVRLDNRPAHVAYLKANEARIVLAGPLLSDDGQAMIGSLLVLDFDNRRAADRFLADDPYGKAGLFESVSVTPFRKVLPQSP